MDPVRSYIVIGRMMESYHEIICNSYAGPLWDNMMDGYEQMFQYRRLLEDILFSTYLVVAA